MAAAHAAADEACGRVWLLSTRCAPRCGDLAAAASQINYWRLDGEKQWLSADRQSLLHGDDRSLPTAIFIHGNRTDADAAIEKSWALCGPMQRQAAGQPFRFVIWSWPSDRIAGGVRCDAEVKAGYSDAEAFYLADLLANCDPQTPVSLIGYSFGARVIGGALELLAGGQVAGRSLPAAHAAHRPYRVMLIAAAMDADWLLPGHRNGLALGQVEKLFSTCNACDRAMKWYPRMYGRGGPTALGFAGPALCGAADKIELFDVSCWVGRQHDWTRYATAPAITSRLLRYAFLDPAAPGL